MYDGRTKLADQVADEVRNHFGDVVLQAVIPRNVRVSEAPGYGQSVLTYDPGSRGSTSYVEAARQLAERGVDLPPIDRAGSPAAPTAPPVAADSSVQRSPDLYRDTRSGDDQARRPGPRAGCPHPHQCTGPGAGSGDATRPRAGARRTRAGGEPGARSPSASPSPRRQPCRRRRRAPAPAAEPRARSASPARSCGRWRSRTSSPTRSSRVRSSTTRRWRSSATPCGSSACSSRSSSGRTTPGDGAGYELIMGERRLRAARAAGLDTVPAIVRDTTDDAMLRDALLENIHRVQLNPLEEAAAYQQLLEEFGATHEELASKIGRSRSQVTNTIRLMKLPVKVQTRVAAGVISAGHARALLGLPGRRRPGRARDADRRRGHERPRHRGGGRDGGRRAAHGQAPARARSARPGSRSSAPGCPTCSRRRSRSRSAGPRARIVVEFGSVDDLQRIIGVMAPGDHRTPSRGLNAAVRRRRRCRRELAASGRILGPPGEQPGEHLAELVAGGLDGHREHRRLGETRGHVHLEEVHLAVRH